MGLENKQKIHGTMWRIEPNLDVNRRILSLGKLF